MPFGTGARPSERDSRTFTYAPNYKKAPLKVGERWDKKYVRHQHKVGICSSIALTQQATRHFGVEMSPDWLYRIQSILYDDWDEGSSELNALKAGTKIGFLPRVEMDKWVTEEDREGSYEAYVRKLKAIPANEIERLKTIAAKYKLAGYYSVPFNWEVIKNAIAESKYGVIARFEVGSEWYTSRDGKRISWAKEDVEPLRPPTLATIQSGHIVTISNADGTSYRIANSWGEEWADEGTAYSLWLTYRPTECWLPVFPDTPTEAAVLEERRKLEETLRGLLIQWAQKLLVLLRK